MKVLKIWEYNRTIYIKTDNGYFGQNPETCESHKMSFVSGKFKYDYPLVEATKEEYDIIWEAIREKKNEKSERLKNITALNKHFGKAKRIDLDDSYECFVEAYH